MSDVSVARIGDAEASSACKTRSVNLPIYILLRESVGYKYELMLGFFPRINFTPPVYRAISLELRANCFTHIIREYTARYAHFSHADM